MPSVGTPLTFLGVVDLREVRFSLHSTDHPDVLAAEAGDIGLVVSGVAEDLDMCRMSIWIMPSLAAWYSEGLSRGG